ncbi:MAG: 16S rRNA (adenine(1518)-N(6)/adenine(1519)-N(6))-dimethyltransferase RsmA [Gammaproteobacteria bacterium]
MSHRARKRFGQHFLHDQSVIQRIVDCMNPSQDDTVVEIGPGLGALSKPLLQRLDRLQVVELDRDVIPLLKGSCDAGSRLTVHEADALKFDFGQLLPDSGEPLRLCGNLPYNISTPLLFHLYHWSAGIRDMHFMLQKEVVDRLAAKPGDKLYGRLSVMTSYYCQADSLFNVGPEAFNPPPKVDSAVVRLIPHQAPPVELVSQESLSRVVTQAFNQRRKTLGRIFKGQLNAEGFAELGIDPQLRPERLSLQDFASIANALSRH